MNAIRLALVMGVLAGLAGCDETEAIVGRATHKGVSAVPEQPPLDAATEEDLRQRIKLQSYN